MLRFGLMVSALEELISQLEKLPAQAQAELADALLVKVRRRLAGDGGSLSHETLAALDRVSKAHFAGLGKLL